MPLTACPDCDLLQRVPLLHGTERALCGRCDAVLLSASSRSSAHSFALAVTAGICFLIANIFPIVSLESQGMQTTGTVLGSVSLLWQTGMHFIALIVLATAFVVPGAELALLLIALGSQAPAARILRWLKWMRPWAMIDVFVLGVIVSIKKLADMATIIPGPALWAFCALMFLIPALRNGLDFPALWSRVSFSGTPHAR